MDSSVFIEDDAFDNHSLSVIKVKQKYRLKRCWGCENAFDGRLNPRNTYRTNVLAYEWLAHKKSISHRELHGIWVNDIYKKRIKVNPDELWWCLDGFEDHMNHHMWSVKEDGYSVRLIQVIQCVTLVLKSKVLPVDLFRELYGYLI